MTADLIRRIRHGDVAAFEELFREFHAPLCEVVDSYVRSQAIAEEIVQDLFFAIWLKRDALDATSLRGYLFRAARNRALHHLRHQSIVRRFARLIDALPEVSGVAHTATRPDAALLADDQRQQLRRAIDHLPPRSRLALVLRIDHGMADRDIAEALGVSAKGVEKLMDIARKHLRQQLRDDADILSSLED